jgi:AcrR family transcriptional regulator
VAGERHPHAGAVALHEVEHTGRDTRGIQDLGEDLPGEGGGRVGIPGIPQASYAASKAGLSGLTAELAVQWARHSIRVNTVAPGFFRSEITSPLHEGERAAQYLPRNPPLPKEGTADDIVGAVLWLVGDAGSYVTGQTVVVMAAGPPADSTSCRLKGNGYAEVMPSTRRTARQTDLLERLVALLAAEGFASFTLDELTERLRCSKTTLYQLAGSKQELVREAVKHYFRSAAEVIEKQVTDTSAPAERVVVYLNAVAEQLRPLSRRFLDDMAGFEPAREVYEANTRLAAGRIRQLIADGVAAGAFRDVHAAFVGEVVAATMQEIQRGEVSARTGLTDAEAYAELASLIVHAVST